MKCWSFLRIEETLSSGGFDDDVFSDLANHLFGSHNDELNALLDHFARLLPGSAEVFFYRCQLDRSRNDVDALADRLLPWPQHLADDLDDNRYERLAEWAVSAALAHNRRDEAAAVAQAAYEHTAARFPRIALAMNARRLQELIEEFEDLPQHRIANLYRRDELKPLQFEALFKPLRDRFPPQINWWRRKAPLIVLCERLPEISGEALAARLASALERPVPVRAIPPLSDAAAKTFVAGPADEQLMVTLGSGRYDASPSDRAASAANEALQAALDKLQAWLRVEAADWHKAEDQKALRQVARVVAALADEHSLALYLEDGSRLALFDEAARRALASPEPGKQLELLGEERFLFRHLDEELGPSEKELEKHLAALPAAWSSLPEGEQILVQVPLRAGGAEEPVWLKLERLVRHQSGDWRYVVEFPSDSLLAPQFRRGERATVWGYEIRDWKQVSSGGTM